MRGADARRLGCPVGAQQRYSYIWICLHTGNACLKPRCSCSTGSAGACVAPRAPKECACMGADAFRSLLNPPSVALSLTAMTMMRLCG